VTAPGFEVDARPDDQVLDGARREDFARPRQRGDASADVHRDAADLVTEPFDLAGMEPGAHR
jgi:hypothetical protein